MTAKNPTPDAIGRLVAARPLRTLARALAENNAATASGLWGSSVALVTAAIEAELHRPVLVVCGHIDEADDLADDMQLFHGRRPEVVPALELGGTLGRVSEELVANRMQTMSRLIAASNGKNAGDPPLLLVSPIHSLMQSVPSRDQLAYLILTLKAGQSLEAEKLIVWLSDHGYNRLDQVEVPGDFAVRGGIIDIYVPGEFPEAGEQLGLTIRVDFFDDQIESIKRFDLDSLGSQTAIDSVQLLDLKGQLPDTGSSTHLFSYLPPETVIVLYAPLEIAEQAKAYFDRLPEVKGIYPLSAVLKNAAPFARLELSQFDQGATSLLTAQAAAHVRLPIGSLQKFETEANKAIAELAEMSQTHQITIFCDNAGEAHRFGELLDMHAPGLRAKIDVPIGYLHRGFRWDESVGSALADGIPGVSEVSPTGTIPSAKADPTSPSLLLGHHELFHRYEQRRRVKKVIASRPVDSFIDLKVGDYVVHVAHGIAKFTGVQQITKDGKSEEYLTLRFADNATLHVPAARINLIQKYIGGFSGHPTLSRLGSGSWEKQKQKVSEAVMDMAAEMITIQAAREAEMGTAYPPDTEWQREFEAEFPYEPTQDQVTAAEDIKADMQKRRPMDRLLCGDVGYGKTEMAMRAAFKAIEYGKQVAVLVPTTVLAEQHYRSFSERMADYPFKVESISRFKSAGEQKETIKRLAAGEIDILIGTHRLISKDVKFSDLGLVVVDEEQRFGVTHKERLKQMRSTVDVLTMSATPIPRTLHMSMLGLRDISSLTTAPQDRRSVVTEVIPFDRERVKQAILRELMRGGQTYFVHNRVANILEVAEEVQRLVPEARILVGHGQMADGEMEEAMLGFIRHDADILVCTTIIESGLDIPNANTIIINNADRFGLSELHQLRGRVGRWKHRAYCYLMLPSDRPVTPVAAKRLKAIEEYSHLGAGFKIAMRDLELRGAGNILGPEQSGHIATVGYEMYCQLLEEATRQLKNEPKPTRPEAHVELGLSAYIPKTYIANDRQRLDVYRRLTRCTDLDMCAMLEQDLKDAFGEPPRQVLVLLALTELRLLAGLYGIDSIIKKEPDIVLTVNDALKAQPALAGAPGTVRIIDDKSIYLRMPPSFLEGETALMVLRNLMRAARERDVRTGAGGAPVEVAEVKPEAPVSPLIASAKAHVLPAPPPPVAPPKPVAAEIIPARPVASPLDHPPREITPAERSRHAIDQRAARAKVTAAAKVPSAASRAQKSEPGQLSPELEKLTSLVAQGILSEEEFQSAIKRLAAKG